MRSKNVKDELQPIKDVHFEKLRNGIQEELLSTNEHFNIISGFVDAPRQITAIMRKYQTFFIYTQWAHIKLLCISLYNVTKHNEQTSNFPRLLCYIRFHKTLSKKYPTHKLDVFENKLKSHSPFLELVYTLRDQHYAHNQLNSRKLNTTLGDIITGCKSLLPDLESIFDFVSLEYDRSTWDFHTVPSVNVVELLTDLSEYKKLRKHDR